MILAIDQGTTGTTCLVFGDQGAVVGRAYSEISQHYPSPGRVEHDPEELWRSTLDTGLRAIAAAGITASDLEGIGITNQRETAIAWDRRARKPLCNAIVWQDRRTAGRCAELRAQGLESMVREKTGLILDPYFSATKFEWMLANIQGAESARLGTVDAWLLEKLCARHATDFTNASRTLLFDIASCSWDGELCAVFGIDPEQLPEPVPSASVLGTTDAFGAELPVASMIGDQQAALFGQACTRPGEAKNTYGTGSFVLLNTGPDKPQATPGLLSTIAWGIREPGSTAMDIAYALEASIFVTGAAVQWLRDGLGIIDSAAETEHLAASLTGNDGVYFVPALTGLGSPYWDPDARGLIVGLTRGTTRAHVARAALEAIAYETVDAVRTQEAACDSPLAVMKADGGGTANGWLMQFQADLLGVPVRVPDISETTAAGAAYLAGIAIGKWSRAEIESMCGEQVVYEPGMAEEERERLLGGWKQAVERSRSWAG